MNKNHYALITGLLLGTTAMAQLKIGTNPTSINSNAILEMQTTTKGMLPPRIALTAINNMAPLSAFVTGMTVYNTATAGSGLNAVTPGYYYSDGTKWVRLKDGGTADVQEPWRNATTGAAADSSTVHLAFNKGNVGINTGMATPGARLEVNGTFRLKDGTQGAGRTLVSDANGTASWSPASAGTTLTAIGFLSATGVSVNGTNTAIQTGSYIDLAPGKWLVNVVMLASNNANQVASGDGIWIRSSFSNAANSTTVSADIVGSTLISGLLSAPMRYGLVNGLLLINNTSGTTKRYYYFAYGESMPGTPTNFSVTSFGSTAWGEDQIFGVPVN